MSTKQVNQEPQTLQIGGEKYVYVIDCISLKGNKKLDEVLSKVFSSPNSIILGFSFHNDYDKFKDSFRFMDYIQNFIDIQELIKVQEILYKHDGSRQMGLKKACQEYLGQDLCKFDTISNWAQRPLRKAQMHYAALDANVLVSILKRMKEDFPAIPFYQCIKSLIKGGQREANASQAFVLKQNYPHLFEYDKTSFDERKAAYEQKMKELQAKKDEKMKARKEKMEKKKKDKVDMQIAAKFDQALNLNDGPIKQVENVQAQNNKRMKEP